MNNDVRLRDILLDFIDERLNESQAISQASDTCNFGQSFDWHEFGIAQIQQTCLYDRMRRGFVTVTFPSIQLADGVKMRATFSSNALKYAIALARLLVVLPNQD